VKDGETMVDQNIISLFNNIYDTTNRKVLGFITKCSNTSDIRDIFQDTYMELYTVIVKRGLGYIENSEAFVMRIAKQKVYRYYSLLDRLKFAAPLFVADNDGNEINIADLESDDYSLDISMLNRALIEDIRREISTKPQIVQKIFFMRYSLDMTIPEIAELLSVGESYVKNKLYRTISELRKLYVGKEGFDL
jgi:RNA polymerase sigma-70 factor (ECF subfamily)